MTNDHRVVAIPRDGQHLVDNDDIEHVRVAIELADIGAQAALRLSCDDANETRFLRLVRTYKETEEQYAVTLDYQSVAAMAAFHVARATALLEADIDGEIAAFLNVTARLATAAKGGEPIDADDIALLVARLCTVQLAYPDHRAKSQIASVRAKLVSLARTAETRDALKALTAAVDSHPNYDPDTSPISLLQMLQFGTIGYVCIGRILESQYRRAVRFEAVAQTREGAANEDTRDGQPADRHLADAFGLSPDISHVLTLKPADFHVAALSYYRRACTGTRKSGSAGVLRTQVTSERQRLLAERPIADDELDSGMPPMEEQTLKGLTAAIDRLVLRGLVAAPAARKQFLQIRHHIDPIYQFLT